MCDRRDMFHLQIHDSASGPTAWIWFVDEYGRASDLCSMQPVNSLTGTDAAAAMSELADTLKRGLPYWCSYCERSFAAWSDALDHLGMVACANCTITIDPSDEDGELCFGCARKLQANP